MVKTYSAAAVKRIVDELFTAYDRELQVRQARIEALYAENNVLSARLSSLEGREKTAFEGELDMEKILRPDPELRLDSLCKELGVMDDEK